MELTSDQKVAFKKLAHRHRLKLIIAFGSQVTKNIHAESDLDIAVRSGKNEISLKEFTDITYALEKIFNGKKIDLCFINRADPLLLKKIAESAFLLYGVSNDFAEFKCFSFRRFEDYRPYFKLEERFVRNYIKELQLARR